MSSALGSGVGGGAPLLPGYGPPLNATDPFGQTSERGKRLIDQLELQLAELEETAAEDEAAVEAAKAKAGTIVAAHARHFRARRARRL